MIEDVKCCPHCNLPLGKALCPVLKEECKHAKINTLGDWCSKLKADMVDLDNNVCTFKE